MKNIPVALFFAMIMIIAPSAPAMAFGSPEAVETAANGSINWTVGEVYATGIGAPPAGAANPAQARAMAQRAAFVVALRNLLETVKGVRVDSESVVENFMVRSDVVRTRVDGIVKGARIIKTQYLSDGSVEVLVSLPMKGEFLNAVVPETFGRPAAVLTPAPALIPSKPSDIKPPQNPARQEPAPPPAAEPEAKIEPVQPEKKTEPPRPEPGPAPVRQAESTVAFKGGVATGLVIDGRGIGLRPALLPKIIDEQGREVYVGQVVTRTNAVEQGVAGYAKDVSAASNNFRVTDNPAVIKAVNAAGPAKTDLVISQADANALRQLSSKGNFLQYCRVIVVY